MLDPHLTVIKCCFLRLLKREEIQQVKVRARKEGPVLLRAGRNASHLFSHLAAPKILVSFNMFSMITHPLNKLCPELKGRGKTT